MRLRKKSSYLNFQKRQQSTRKLNCILKLLASIEEVTNTGLMMIAGPRGGALVQADQSGLELVRVLCHQRICRCCRAVGQRGR
jgi:hypothetical protein